MKKRSFLLMLLAVSLFSSCKDDTDTFVPEGLQTLVEGDCAYDVGGNKFNMIYVPEVVVQQTVDQNLDSLKLVVNPSYYIMQTEVTQGLYMYVMGSNPSQEGYIGTNLPVNYVNLHDCDKFAKALSSQMGKTGNQRFRVPSSREWIIAARGGSLASTTEYSGSDDLTSVAWYSGNSDGHIHTIGLKAPNQLGLYDMSGNVSEWVNDSRVDIAQSPTSANGSTYGGNFSSTTTMCSISGTSSTLTSSTSSANNTHYTNGVRLVSSVASDTLLRLSDVVITYNNKNERVDEYVWKVVPKISGTNVEFNVYDNLATGSTAPKYTISLNLVSNKTISAWELFPENYYILYANESNQDITGTVLDVDNNTTYQIESGVMAIYSGKQPGSRGFLNMNGMTLVANNGAVVKSLVGARQLSISDFDLAEVAAIYPTLDANDATGRTCIFKAENATGAEMATVTATLTASAPISSWNFYQAATLNIGSDVTVTATTPDGGSAEFTVGTLEFLTEAKISFNATGTYNGEVYDVTTVNTTGKALNLTTYNVEGVTAVATVTPDKPYECTVDFGSKGKLIMVLKNQNATWQFPATGYKNYDMDVDGNALGSADNYITEAKFVSADGTVSGAINAGSITFGYNTVKPNLTGWVNGELQQMAGSVSLTVQ